jgi:hypothetical protein
MKPQGAFLLKCAVPFVVELFLPRFHFVLICWQQIEMSGSVTNELSAFSTSVVGDGHRLFLLV